MLKEGIRLSSMFCYQCQEAAGGTSCSVRGVCGNTSEVSGLQDLLIYAVKGVAKIVVQGKLDVASLGEINQHVINDLFMTITLIAW